MKVFKRIVWWKIKKILPICLSLIFLAGLGIFLIKNEVLRVKKISCQENDRICSPELWADLMSLTVGKNPLFLPKKTLAEKISAKYPYLKKIEIKREFPSGVVYKLIKSNPEAAIVAELSSEEAMKEKAGFLTGGDFFLIDRQGILLAKEKSSDLPLILLKDLPNIAVGEKFVQEEVVKAVEIIINLKLVLLEPKLARILSSKDVEIWLKEGTKILFSKQKNLSIQVDSLQLIFSRTKIEGKRIAKIDLRFEKPVVNYE